MRISDMRTATAHDYDANKTNIITGKLEYVEHEFVFTPDFMPNARATYVNDLFKKGIDTKIFITSGGSGYTGYVCRLLISLPTTYTCEMIDIVNISNLEDGGTSIKINNVYDVFTVQINEI